MPRDPQGARRCLRDVLGDPVKRAAGGRARDSGDPIPARGLGALDFPLAGSCSITHIEAPGWACAANWQDVVDRRGPPLTGGLRCCYSLKPCGSILFGVSVTAAIDVLVDEERMVRFPGGRDLRATGKATMLGAASSACTFGAVSIAQTLFKKVASAESAFALASTNIVFELGILIYVLMGWQFLAAEPLSGFVLVAIMYLLVRATLPVGVFEIARRRLQEQEGEPVLPQAVGVPVTEAPARPGWREQLKGKDIWYRIAVRYFKTLRRIYKSVVFGFLIAGFIVA